MHSKHDAADSSSYTAHAASFRPSRWVGTPPAPPSENMQTYAFLGVTYA